MYSIVICDDDKSYVDYMKEIILESGNFKDEVLFYEFYSGEELLEGLQNIENCDLLILDMQLKNIDGHETAARFRKSFSKSTLVFCSGVFHPTDESFKATPFRYLLKSYTKEKMLEEMQMIIKEMKSRRDVPIIVGSYFYNTVCFEPDDILYIENYRFGSIIHAYREKIDYDFEKGDRNITTKKKLSELYNILKPFGFEYAHNSYIVNMRYVIKLPSNGELKLRDGTILTVSRSKRILFREAFSEWLGHKY